MNNLFKGVRCLTELQYKELKEKGTLEIDGVTYSFEEDWLYVTPEDVTAIVRKHTQDIAALNANINSIQTNVADNKNNLTLLKSNLTTISNDVADIKTDINDIITTTVTLDGVQTITGPKTFTESIYLANTDGTIDRIAHINNNFIIYSGSQSGLALLNIDEGLEKIYAFNNELAFKTDIAEAGGSKLYVNNEIQSDVYFNEDPQTQLDNKLDKVTAEFDAGATRGYVYFINTSNEQTIKKVQIQANPDTIPLRNPDGNFYVADPKLDYECTNKRYVDNIFNGASKPITYDTYSEMITALNGMSATDLNRGQDIFIVQTGIPDVWVAYVEETSVTYTYVDDDTFVNELLTNGVVQVGYYKLGYLETQKVDLAEYVKNTDYADDNNFGVVKTKYSYGIQSENGVLYIRRATSTEINQRQQWAPITPYNLDYAVKVGLTTNTETLTDDEKTTAQSWLGIADTFLPKAGGILTGPLIVSGGDAITGVGNIQLATDGNITAQGTTATLFGRTSASDLTVGHSSHNLKLRGSAANPTYNGTKIVLDTDLTSMAINGKLLYGGIDLAFNQLSTGIYQGTIGGSDTGHGRISNIDFQYSDSTRGTIRHDVVASSVTVNRPASDSYLTTYFWDSVYKAAAQIAIGTEGSQMQIRGMSNNTWSAWRTIAEQEWVNSQLAAQPVYTRIYSGNPAAGSTIILDPVITSKYKYVMFLVQNENGEYLAQTWLQNVIQQSPNLEIFITGSTATVQRWITLIFKDTGTLYIEGKENVNKLQILGISRS